MTEALPIARRYATAIFALAREAKSESATTADFGTLAAAIRGDAALADALGNPTIANEKKAAVLAALAAKADPLARRAIDSIALGGRASILPVIADQLARMLAAHQGELAATVVSARPLSAAVKQQLSKSLAAATGKEVKLELKEDASVLGGLLIELGSLRLDATLSGALNQMREQLLAPTHS
jgi:F-type H+-transporting ATPase subunit delta